MKNDTYKFLSTIYKEIIIDDIEVKNSKFTDVINSLIKVSKIKKIDIDNFMILQSLLNEDMCKILINKDDLYDEIINLETLINVLIIHFNLKYGELKTYKMIEEFISVIETIFENIEYSIDDDKLKLDIILLTYKSKSVDKKISTSAKMKLIKLKRSNMIDEDFGGDDEYSHFIR